MRFYQVYAEIKNNPFQGDDVKRAQERDLEKKFCKITMEFSEETNNDTGLIFVSSKDTIRLSMGLIDEKTDAKQFAVIFFGLQVQFGRNDRFFVGRALGDDVTIRCDEEGRACERRLLVGGGAYGVHGCNVDLVFDGASLEECFPVGASFGGPGCLDRDEVCALLGCFTENLGEPQVVADKRSDFPIG